MTFDLCPSHLLPQLALVHETLQLVGQVGVFVAQLVVSGAVLLDLGLDFCQLHLEVAGHLLPLLLILPAALKGLSLKGGRGGREGPMGGERIKGSNGGFDFVLHFIFK